MKIRIMAPQAEAEQAVKAISDADGLDVIEASDSRPNRGNSRMVRIYIEARLSHHASPGRQHQPRKGTVRCSFPGEPTAS